MVDANSSARSQELREWKTRWERAAPVMEKLRRRELREMSEEEHRQTLVDVLEFAQPELARTQICGLADFYRRRLKP